MAPSEDASVSLSRTNISNVPSLIHSSIRKPKTKAMRTTCCLDPRTELTDDELKVSRLPRKDSRDLFTRIRPPALNISNIKKNLSPTRSERNSSKMGRN
jgi:hypothetical protein